MSPRGQIKDMKMIVQTGDVGLVGQKPAATPALGGGVWTFLLQADTEPAAVGQMQNKNS